MNANEIDQNAIGHDIKDEEVAIEAKDASFSWNPEDQKATVSNMNFRIKKGSSVAIVGKFNILISYKSDYYDQNC